MDILTLLFIKPFVLLLETIFVSIFRLFTVQLALPVLSVIVGIVTIPLVYCIEYNSKDDKSIKDKIAYAIQMLLRLCAFISSFVFFYSVKQTVNKKFLLISNLGESDSILQIGYYSFNLLPIFFLIFSLILIVLKYHKSKSLKIISDIAVDLGFYLALINAKSSIVVFWILVYLVYIFVYGIFILFKKNSIKTNNNKKSKEMISYDSVFFVSIAFLVLLSGIIIPSNIIKVSVSEFVDVIDISSPLKYVLYSTLYSLGLFGIWFCSYYFFANSNLRKILQRVILAFAMISFVDYLMSGTAWGEISPSLVYLEFMDYNTSIVLINISLLIVVSVIILVLLEKLPIIAQIILYVQVFMLIISSFSNVLSINKDYKKLDYLKTQETSADIIRLSKTGKNVVVLIIDRALGPEVPYIFNERPGLKEQFDGFVYYPNTVSFGGFTNAGIPSVYGGYEYTPENMNSRDDELLEYKHNEALKVMPVMFEENDYQVTVCDPAYAGYNWIPDLSIYEDYPEIRAYNTEGRFNSSAPEESQTSVFLKRNFFAHSIIKMLPLNWHYVLYNYGHYCDPNFNHSISHSIYSSEGFNNDFINSYYVLDNLSNITTIEDGDVDNFLLFYNGTAHMPCMLQEPDYVPQMIVDNSSLHPDGYNYVYNGIQLAMEDDIQVTHFHVNMAAYIKIGEWFDYLREQGVYDNTRIIIVSDHGRDTGHLNLKKIEHVDVEYFIPVLMVKDFNSKGLSISDEFMTNADVASIASEGILSDRKNPFTGNTLDGREKDDEIKIYFSHDCDLIDCRGTTYNPGRWFSVHDNPYDINNWSYLGNY